MIRLTNVRLCLSTYTNKIHYFCYMKIFIAITTTTTLCPKKTVYLFI